MEHYDPCCGNRNTIQRTANRTRAASATLPVSDVNQYHSISPISTTNHGQRMNTNPSTALTAAAVYTPTTKNHNPNPCYVNTVISNSKMNDGTYTRFHPIRGSVRRTKSFDGINPPSTCLRPTDHDFNPIRLEIPSITDDNDTNSDSSSSSSVSLSSTVTSSRNSNYDQSESDSDNTNLLSVSEVLSMSYILQFPLIQLSRLVNVTRQRPIHSTLRNYGYSGRHGISSYPCTIMTRQLLYFSIFTLFILGHLFQYGSDYTMMETMDPLSLNHHHRLDHLSTTPSTQVTTNDEKSVKEFQGGLGLVVQKTGRNSENGGKTNDLLEGHDPRNNELTGGMKRQPKLALAKQTNENPIVVQDEPNIHLSSSDQVELDSYYSSESKSNMRKESTTNLLYINKLQPSSSDMENFYKAGLEKEQAVLQFSRMQELFLFLTCLLLVGFLINTIYKWWKSNSSSSLQHQHRSNRRLFSSSAVHNSVHSSSFMQSLRFTPPNYHRWNYSSR